MLIARVYTVHHDRNDLRVKTNISFDLKNLETSYREFEEYMKDNSLPDKQSYEFKIEYIAPE